MNDRLLDPKTNALLSKLPQADFDRLQPHLVEGNFKQGLILTETGHEVEHVYFPLQGMISLVVVMNDGKAIETTTLGRHAVFGAMAGFGKYVSTVRAIVQMPLIASRISAEHFRTVTKDSKALQHLSIFNNDAMLNQARITAACNALHKVEARFARWLLQTRDVTDSDTIVLTQEIFAEMLGVRRTSVTDVAIKVQSAGIIAYSRGVIKILDKARLEAASCECYAKLRDLNAL